MQSERESEEKRQVGQNQVDVTLVCVDYYYLHRKLVPDAKTPGMYMFGCYDYTF